MSYRDPDTFNDSAFIAVIDTLSCKRPYRTPTARRYDSYYYNPRGVKNVQFVPEIDRMTFRDDDRTRSDNYVTQSYCTLKADPAYLRFSTENE